MPTVQLQNRSIVDVTGQEAEHFLQNLITADLDVLPAGEARPGALLSPQGKVLFDFLVSRNGAESFVLDCRADVADDFVRRLTLYKLRAKVTIAKRDQALVGVSWQNESGSSNAGATLRDKRFPVDANVHRHYAAVVSDTGEADWHALRVTHAVAESGSDFALADAFPHDMLLDQNDGVGFRKGCYVGQEVVSRMQHRGTARRRVLIATAGAVLPASGTEILANGRAIGALGTVAGSSALAIVRIDKVKDAVDAGLPITTGGVEVRFAIPAWARFTFPATGAEAESA